MSLGMCCGYLLMPFWTFFIATALGKGVVKVNGQAVVFVNLFGSAAFEILLKGFDSFNALILAVLGKDLQLRDVVSGLRAKLLAKFQQHNRFPPEQLFQKDKNRNKLRPGSTSVRASSAVPEARIRRDLYVAARV